MLVEAAVLGAIDYKRTFAKEYASDEERLEAYSQCHLRSANRVLRALLANGGSYLPPHPTHTLDLSFKKVLTSSCSRCIHKVRATHGFSVSFIKFWLWHSFLVPAQRRIAVGMDEHYAAFAGQV